MFYRIEEWVVKEKWWILGFTVVSIYLLMFNISKARFICNDSMCRVEYINQTGKNIVKTTEVNIDNIQNFEIRRSYNRRARGHRHGTARRYRYHIFAVDNNGTAYNFFKCYAYNETAAQQAVDYLNEEIVKENKNIDIKYPIIEIHGKRRESYEHE